MLYILIFIIISIFLDYNYYFSNKLFNIPTDQKGIKIFLYIIYIFPVAIATLALYFIDKLETKEVFTPIVSFYATALTITFTVFSFYKAQEKNEKDRNEREKQQEKERKERENKDFELREKELETKRDYYRPIFVIENKKNYPYKKQVKLLMKDDSLYLENVMVHYNSIDRSSILKQFKSGEIINQKIDSSFYISAQTLIGETILFGYLDNGIKIYKYLKNNKDPQYPTIYDIRNRYNQ